MMMTIYHLLYTMCFVIIIYNVMCSLSYCVPLLYIVYYMQILHVNDSYIAPYLLQCLYKALMILTSSDSNSTQLIILQTRVVH